MEKAESKAKGKKPRYEPLIDFPALSNEEYVGLRDSIAIHGVLVPILVDCDGPVRRIIDGRHRKQFADEFGYDCPEEVREGDEEELRGLARALNLARRHLSADQKRQIIADQLCETPDRTNRFIAKMLGVHHATVASVRGEMESEEVVWDERRVGSDGKSYKPTKSLKAVPRSSVERQTRLDAVTLIQGDCRKELRKIASNSIDAIVTDPIYPEVDRPYGRMSERDWHGLMKEAVAECRRVLKPKGSAVFILQPNFERIGRMRLWLWDFVAWAGRAFDGWGLVQDVYWWSTNTLPTTCVSRKHGLLRQSVKWCVWLGPADSYRNQENVLWEVSDALSALRWSDRCLQHRPSGHALRAGRMAEVAINRGGSTPFNIVPISNHIQEDEHPSATPYDVAAWWCRYILPPGGVLLDPFVGSGTMLVAGLDSGASRVIGIDREREYLAIARRRVVDG